jgi:hypothetical protein
MSKCKCNKFICDCFKESIGGFSEVGYLIIGLKNLEEAVDQCIENMAKYDLKK